MSLFRDLYRNALEPLEWKDKDINDYERFGRIIASIWLFAGWTLLYLFCVCFIVGGIVYAGTVAAALLRKL